jgi:hypothetical protein
LEECIVVVVVAVVVQPLKLSVSPVEHVHFHIDEMEAAEVQQGNHPTSSLRENNKKTSIDITGGQSESRNQHLAVFPIRNCLVLKSWATYFKYLDVLQ